MVQSPWNVVRLELPLDAVTFDGTLRADAAVSLQVAPARGDDAAAWRALAAAHVYHVSSARDELPRQWFVTRELIARCPQLLAVSSYGAGYDTVEVAACTAAGICVMNQAGSNAGAVAEHTLGLILGLSKRIIQCDRQLRRGERFARHEMSGVDLEGGTLGVIGIGHTGGRVAALARAFGMTVLACDPWLTAQEIAQRGATSVTLAQLLGRADVVSVHCPLNDTTRGMIDAKAFAAMQPGALFISTARGGIHDETALFDALVSGHLGGAGLDVWSIEPPAAGHPLLGLDNVFASHHIAGVTRGARRNMALMAAGQIIDTARGMRPPRLVNPEVWPAYARRYAQLTGRQVAGAAGA